MQVTTSVGRFQRADLERELSDEALRSGAFFIVGSSPAVLANQRLLRRMGVARRRIHQERLM
jgi:ferredoxin-NADP reductase